MATPLLRKVLDPAASLERRKSARDSTALRLLSAERSEEIFPILLEEIVGLGFPRAMLLEVDLESGDIKPTAWLKCNNAQLQKFRTSLWSTENPVVASLHRM